MLAPNWEDQNPEKKPIINYFANRQHTKMILRKTEKNILQSCIYCRNYENCTKLFAYNEVFKQQGFWSFNRHITCWNIFDSDWSSKNRIFKLLLEKCKLLWE